LTEEEIKLNSRGRMPWIDQDYPRSSPPVFTLIVQILPTF